MKNKFEITEKQAEDLICLQDTYGTLIPKEYYLVFKQTLCNSFEIDALDESILSFLEQDGWDKLLYKYKATKNSSKENEIVFIKDDLFIKLIKFGNGKYNLQFAFPFDHDEVVVNKYKETLLESKKFSKGSKFFILMKEYNSYDVKEYPVNLPKNLNLEYDYGPDFYEAHQAIYEKFKTNDSGLFIFHGTPGCGKSTYIKKLAELFPEKKFIYVPEFMVSMLDKPEIMNIFIEQEDAVIVVEDAEKIIIDRNESDSSLVSIILNISDGILSDILNIPIILTYNTKTEKIDQALTRNGRLKYIHEFGPLKIEDVKVILENNGHSAATIEKWIEEGKVFDDMPICDIFSIEDDIGEVKSKEDTKVVGFSK